MLSRTDGGRMYGMVTCPICALMPAAEEHPQKHPAGENTLYRVLGSQYLYIAHDVLGGLRTADRLLSSLI